MPAAVAAIAGGRAMTLVWQNEAGGLTFEIAAGDGAGRRFIKWAPEGSYLDLAAEAARMTWAGQFHPVPQVLDRAQASSVPVLAFAPAIGTACPLTRTRGSVGDASTRSTLGRPRSSPWRMVKTPEGGRAPRVRR